ncbi:MAG: DNA polymerase III subunit delta, partial [Desulfovibrionaceae bacterium]|nr:DNA polymerase III subunit delta [Desulfovibrionaceae bacterium]
KSGDSLLFSLLALLARDLRLLWQLNAGEKVRLHPNEATFKQQLARKLGTHGLAAGLAAVVDAEWQVKSGRRSPEQALDFLAAELTLLFGGLPLRDK